MGAAKHAELERQQVVAEVIPIVVRAGALRYCPLHGSDVVLRCWNLDGDRLAYAMATKAWNAGELSAEEREDVVAAVKAAIDDGALECWRCEKLKEE